MKRVIRKLKKLWFTYTGNEEGFLALKIQRSGKPAVYAAKISSSMEICPGNRFWSLLEKMLPWREVCTS